MHVIPAIHKDLWALSLRETPWAQEKVKEKGLKHDKVFKSNGYEKALTRKQNATDAVCLLKKIDVYVSRFGWAFFDV